MGVSPVCSLLISEVWQSLKRYQVRTNSSWADWHLCSVEKCVEKFQDKKL